ncbi:hypothetical protein [Mycoplasma tauri]|uniref:hypothetical protein n=1 Tax=Mycoplasma tauri TaxID=547987 RepID=UPI001CBDF4E9|nr:hypothetical protein [Mycoplasma tauri]
MSRATILIKKIKYSIAKTPKIDLQIVWTWLPISVIPSTLKSLLFIIFSLLFIQKINKKTNKKSILLVR